MARGPKKRRVIEDDSDTESDDEGAWIRRLVPSIKKKLLEVILKKDITKVEADVLKEAANMYIERLKNGVYEKHRLDDAWSTIMQNSTRILKLKRKEEAQAHIPPEPEPEPEPKPRSEFDFPDSDEEETPTPPKKQKVESESKTEKNNRTRPD